MRIRRTIGALALCAAASGGLVACGDNSSSGSDNGSSATAGGGKKVSIYFGGLGAPSADFWRVMKNGADQAARDLGNVRLVWIYPRSVDIASYTEKLEEAIAAKPDGLVVLNIGDLNEVSERAHDEGIRLALEPPPPLSQQQLRPIDSPYVSEVGSDEEIGGERIGQYLIDRGATALVCVVQEVGDATESTRCKGAENAAREQGVSYELLPASLDRNQTAELVRGFLAKHSDYAVLATGPDASIAAASGIKDAGSDTLLGGFDLAPEIVRLIKSGEMAATIDQQPWWRGYMAVLELVHNVRYGLVQPNALLTGPAIVDASNVDEVAALVEQGVR